MTRLLAQLSRRWVVIWPALGLFALMLGLVWKPAGPAEALIAVLVAGNVLAAVHHAEVIAEWVGAVAGAVILAIAVTVIEVGLIVILMADGGPGSEMLARDTVFSAVMISCNGIVGASLVAGNIRNGPVAFNPEGSGAALATVTVLAGLTMVLPNFTDEPGKVYSASQLAFAAVASLALWLMFVSAQTRRHQEMFQPVDATGEPLPDLEEEHRPSRGQALASLGMLLVALVAVIGLAKLLSSALESAVSRLGFPLAFVGVVIALLVLAPESLAAVRASRRDRMQTSMNLAYGSAVASIGLTIPTLAVLSPWLPGDLVLGLDSLEMTLLALTVVAGMLTVVPGRATRLQGGVHLVLLAAYIFLAANP